MEYFRTLVLALCMGIPFWASYTLLPAEPGMVVLKEENPRVNWELLNDSPSLDQPLAKKKDESAIEIESLKLEVSRLSAEIASLKGRCRK